MTNKKLKSIQKGSQRTRWRNIILILAVIALIVFTLYKTYNVETPLSVEEPETCASELQTLDLEPEPEPEPRIINPQLASLTNILDLDDTFLVDMKYATTDNFTGIVLYEDIDGAYLQPEIALRLVEAHRYLKELRPDCGLRLLVYDAARPLSVQRVMWERVKNTPYHRYVANPDRLRLHNFGVAVDLTIADSTGQPLNMGTPFDHFGRASAIDNEEGLIQEGLLTRQHVQNRELLRKVMRHAGFMPIRGEWWHFNACSLREARQRYTVIE